MRRLLAAAGMLALALSLGAGEASATIVYTFSGVTFDDGGTLTGTFTTDDAITTLLDFDVTTSPGTDIGFHYTPATADSPSTSLPFILVLGTPALDNILQVTFSGLTAAGAPITLGTTESFEQTPGARRDVVAGEVIGRTAVVPEPSTLALAAVGAVGLLGLGHRRRRKRS